MKLSAPLAVVAAAALLSGGMLTADAATSTNPVKLCSGAFKIVSTPIKGACPRGTSTFYVASKADAQALAARADAADATNAAQSSRLTALESAVAGLEPATQAPTDIVEVLKTVTRSTPGPLSAIATCPEGRYVVSGGATFDSADRGNGYIGTNSARYTGGNVPPSIPTEWIAEGYVLETVNDPQFGEPLTAFAYCAPIID